MSVYAPSSLISIMAVMSMIVSFPTLLNDIYAIDGEFSTALTGKEEVPPVITNSTGLAIFKLSGDTLQFQVNVTDVDAIKAAHIHSGNFSMNGDVVAILFNSDSPSGLINGTLSEGNLSSTDLQGKFQGKSLDDLATAMLNLETYVNVHTVDNPNGEIRGQIINLTVPEWWE